MPACLGERRREKNLDPPARELAALPAIVRGVPPERPLPGLANLIAPTPFATRARVLAAARLVSLRLPPTWYVTAAHNPSPPSRAHRATMEAALPATGLRCSHIPRTLLTNVALPRPPLSSSPRRCPC